MLSKRELGRQILHALIGTSMAGLIYFNIMNTALISFLITIGIILSFIAKKKRIPFVSYFLEHFGRKKEKNLPGKGVIYFFTGVLLSLLLFEKDIALASIMVLSLGDSLSHIIGGKCGKIKNIFRKKSKKRLDGTIAGIISGFLGALIFVSPLEAFMGSLAAMSIEAREISFGKKIVDDNLYIPVIAGAVMVLVRNLV